jgi:hypothetical protein
MIVALSANPTEVDLSKYPGPVVCRVVCGQVFMTRSDGAVFTWGGAFGTIYWEVELDACLWRIQAGAPGILSYPDLPLPRRVSAR